MSSRFTWTRDESGRLVAAPAAAAPVEYESFLEATNIPIPLLSALEEEPMPWIGGLLSGPTGAGKSYQAIRELLAGLRVGASAKFISIPRYIQELRDTAKLEPHEEHVRLLRSAAAARYAVLDDLGAEKLTDYAYEQLYLLFDGRAAKALPTLVTSNLSAQGIVSVHGDRIASRVLGFSAIPPRRLEGRDRRLTWSPENGTTRAAKGSGFLRIAPPAQDDEDSQGAILEDVEPGRPRNGSGA